MKPAPSLLGRRHRPAWAAPLIALAALLLFAPGCGRHTTPDGRPIVVAGSKAFTESAVLGETLVLLARHSGAEARHRARLGDTSKLWAGLLVGDLDVYCEYTGTLTQEIFAGEDVGDEEKLRAALARRGLRLSRPLGFNNTYALGMKRARADELGIRTISDLRNHPGLKLALSNPFLHRSDGWEGVRSRYGLPQATPRGVEHDLAYRALDGGAADVTDLYATDAKIRLYDLRVLEDDRHFFPSYQAVLLWRTDLEDRAPAVVAAFRRLEGALPEEAMIRYNAEAELERVPEPQVAADLLRERLDLEVPVLLDSLATRLLARTGEHLVLVAASLVLAVLLAVPLGVLAAQRPATGQVILGVVGALQTVPGLALLSLLVILLKQLGFWPMLTALVCYGLLPIVRNTHAGLRGIAPSLRESAAALGLSPWARLRLVELPLAMPSILAGIKTAAVLTVGYATLGGLVGAGGYGQPIMTGLNKSDPALILEGAVPAVLLALAVQGLFELSERFLVSRGLRLQAVGE